MHSSNCTRNVEALVLSFENVLLFSKKKEVDLFII